MILTDEALAVFGNGQGSGLEQYTYVLAEKERVAVCVLDDRIDPGTSARVWLGNLGESQQMACILQ